jgi:monoamine oxidase
MSRGYRSIVRYGLRRGIITPSGLSRRGILKAGAGAAAAAVLAGCARGRGNGADQTSDLARGLRVIVVGAGFAGLACADTLARSGADVTVLEATSRPGGRVLTDRKFIPGRNVELGAEFIGENHPTWIRYANRFNLKRIDAIDYEGDEAIILDGQLIRGEQAEQLSAEIATVLANLIEMARPIDPIRPWTSPGADDLDTQTLGDYIRNQPMSDDAKRLMISIEETDSGVPVDRMSLLAQLAMIAGGGFELFYEISETHRLDGGNDRLAAALARSLGNRVRYRSPVASIERTPDRATVTTADGQSFSADAVVLAVPPSVWHKIDFNTHEIRDTPQMGSNVKLILKLDRPVWEAQGIKPEIHSDGLAQLSWISAQARGGSPISFTLFAGGTQSEAMRALPSARRVEEATKSLAPALPDLPAATRDHIFVNWPSIPTALASYSFPAPGQVRAFGPTLVDGMQDGLAPLRFAGEHTSYAFIGYMEGALSSGVRTAEALLHARTPAVV